MLGGGGGGSKCISINIENPCTKLRGLFEKGKKTILIERENGLHAKLIYIYGRNRSGHVDLSGVAAFDNSLNRSVPQSSRTVEAPPDRNRSEIAVGPTAADKAAAPPAATGKGSIARPGSLSDKENSSGRNNEGIFIVQY